MIGQQMTTLEKLEADLVAMPSGAHVVLRIQREDNVPISILPLGVTSNALQGGQSSPRTRAAEANCADSRSVETNYSTWLNNLNGLFRRDFARDRVNADINFRASLKSFYVPGTTGFTISAVAFNIENRTVPLILQTLNDR